MKTLVICALTLAAAALIAMLFCIIKRITTGNKSYTVAAVISGAVVFWPVIFSLCLGFFAV